MKRGFNEHYVVEGVGYIVAKTKGQEKIVVVDAKMIRYLKAVNRRVSVINGYAGIKIDNVQIYLHRIVMDAGDDQMVDHKDRDKLNDVRRNLRFTTVRENARNNGKPGVWWEQSRQRWVATIGLPGGKHGRNFQIGRFKTRKAAIEARIEAEKAFWGYQRHAQDSKQNIRRDRDRAAIVRAARLAARSRLRREVDDGARLEAPEPADRQEVGDHPDLREGALGRAVPDEGRHPRQEDQRMDQPAPRDGR